MVRPAPSAQLVLFQIRLTGCCYWTPAQQLTDASPPYIDLYLCNVDQYLPVQPPIRVWHVQRQCRCKVARH